MTKKKYYDLKKIFVPYKHVLYAKVFVPSIIIVSKAGSYLCRAHPSGPIYKYNAWLERLAICK
jgi:hypothetical protein